MSLSRRGPFDARRWRSLTQVWLDPYHSCHDLHQHPDVGLRRSDALFRRQSEAKLLRADREARIIPQYFFHLEDGRLPPDRDGHTLPDLEAAREAAVLMLGQFLLDDPQEFRSAGTWRIAVTDESGVEVFGVQAVASSAPPVEIEIVPNPAI